MDDIDGHACKLDDLGLRKLPSPSLFIDIPANAGYGGDFPKLLENFRRSNIARMNDALDPAQSRKSFRPQQPVCIRDNPNQNGCPLVSYRPKRPALYVPAPRIDQYRALRACPTNNQYRVPTRSAHATNINIVEERPFRAA